MKAMDADRFRGCLFGGAIGDALGYAVEFLNIAQIREAYGKDGITQPELVDGCALVSDDTQLTLFTANGILVGMTEERTTGRRNAMERYLNNAYMDWHRTQRLVSRQGDVSCWIYNEKELHSVRAPGGTCLRSLASGVMGTMEHPINSSKGCGGLMRVAPIGLYFDPARYPADTALRLGASSAALTHGHPLGFLPAGAFAHMVNAVVYGGYEGGDALRRIAKDTIRVLQETFGAQFEKTAVLTALLEKAIDLSGAGGDDLTNISLLGEGWVAEEALAISLYCALRHHDDFERALIAAANHSGDSDSTAAITGNLLGAFVGYNRIPTSLVDHLELAPVIREIANDLYTDAAASDNAHCDSDVWQKKYVKADYRL